MLGIIFVVEWRKCGSIGIPFNASMTRCLWKFLKNGLECFLGVDFYHCWNIANRISHLFTAGSVAIVARACYYPLNLLELGLRFSRVRVVCLVRDP